ncbi:MAG: GerMN domain-containing protein [Firmicutes bacterium]|nr:GerMN domain-containing protein [Bacillota bacterium]
MKNKVLILFLVLLLGVLTAGCGGQEQQGVDELHDQQYGETEGIVIQQYFASTTYIYEGQDEENGELMPPVEFSLECEEGENIYVAAVNSLIDLPEGQDQYYTMMQERYVCNNVTVEDGMAYVDFSSEGLEGGATTEMVLIDQIVYTLANSFEEIAAVQFTVDGQKTETLMGHIDTSEAFVADYL